MSLFNIYYYKVARLCWLLQQHLSICLLSAWLAEEKLHVPNQPTLVGSGYSEGAAAAPRALSAGRIPVPLLFLQLLHDAICYTPRLSAYLADLQFVIGLFGWLPWFLMFNVLSEVQESLCSAGARGAMAKPSQASAHRADRADVQGNLKTHF